MFDEQTDAFERLVILGKLSSDHKQVKGYDYNTDLKVELKKRDRQSTHLSDVQKVKKEIKRTTFTHLTNVQKPHSVKELLENREPTEWIVDQIGAKGNLVLIAGESGCGKTSLMYSMASAISTGGKFLDTFQSIKKKVLFIQADESKNNCSNKCHTMGLHNDIDFSFAEDGWEHLHLEDVGRLEDQVVGNYEAIFLDSITTLLSGQKHSNKDYEYAMPLYALNDLASRKGLLIVMSSHLKKPENGERTRVTKHCVSGTGAIYSSASDVWTIHKTPRPEFSDHFLFECLGKRNCDGDLSYNLQGDQETFSWYFHSAGGGQLAPHEERLCSTQVLELFYSGDDWLSCKQISERVPHQEQHVRRVLRKLHAQNLLARRSRPSTNGRPTHIYGHPE